MAFIDLCAPDGPALCGDVTVYEEHMLDETQEERHMRDEVHAARERMHIPDTDLVLGIKELEHYLPAMGQLVITQF